MAISACSKDNSSGSPIVTTATTVIAATSTSPTTMPSTIPAGAATAKVNVAFTGDANSEVCGALARWSSLKLDEITLDVNDAEALESFQRAKQALAQSIATLAPDAIFSPALSMAAAAAAETQALEAANFDYSAFISAAPADALRFVPPSNGNPDPEIATIEQYGDEVCGAGEPPLVEIDWSADPGDACTVWQPLVDARLAISNDGPTADRFRTLVAAWTTIAGAPVAGAPANLGTDAKTVAVWIRDRSVPLRSKVADDPRRILTELTGTERVVVALWTPEIRDAAGRIEAFLSTACVVNEPTTGGQ